MSMTPLPAQSIRVLLEFAESGDSDDTPAQATAAICIHCGSIKCGAFAPCGKCGASPRYDGDFAISLVMTDRFNETSTLERFGEMIAGGISQFDLLYSLPPLLRDAALRSWRNIRPAYERGMREAEMPTKVQLGLVNINGDDIPEECVITPWWRFPHVVASVMAFERQPPMTRAEALEQVRRNEAARKSDAG